MNIIRIKRDLAALAFYAERVMPDDSGNRLILADAAEKTAADALQAINELIRVIDRIQQGDRK